MLLQGSPDFSKLAARGAWGDGPGSFAFVPRCAPTTLAFGPELAALRISLPLGTGDEAG